MAIVEVFPYAVVQPRAVLLANAIIAVSEVLEDASLDPEVAKVLEVGIDRLYARLWPRKSSTSSLHIVYPEKRFRLGG